MRLAIALLSLSLLAPNAGGQELSPPEKAANNISHEASICHAYYKVAGHCIRQDGTMEDAADQYEQMSEMSLAIMRAAGELTGVSERAQSARIGLATEKMAQEMEGNCVNISVLLAEYSQSCKVMMERPEDRFNYWLNRAIE